MTRLHPLARSVRSALAAGTVVLAGAGLVACGGGSGSSGGSGSLTVGVTDAPVDEAQHVYVQFSSITLNPSDDDDDDDDDDEPDGSDASDDAGANGDDDDGDSDDAESDDSDFVTIEFDEPKRIDLLAQQNGDSELLVENESVPAGDYDWIRLGVDLGDGESVIVIDGQEFNLGIPSGAQTGLKLVSGFSVADGGELDLTIDFDLRKSVVEAPPGVYKLKPALRLVQTDETGEIETTATANYIGNNCADDLAQAVYVFEGADVTPDDIDGTDPEPVTTVSLTPEEDDAETFSATAAFLEPGDYTVAFTCNPEAESSTDSGDPADDDVAFQDVVNREVEVGETAEYELPLDD